MGLISDSGRYGLEAILEGEEDGVFLFIRRGWTLSGVSVDRFVYRDGELIQLQKASWPSPGVFTSRSLGWRWNAGDANKECAPSHLELCAHQMSDSFLSGRAGVEVGLRSERTASFGAPLNECKARQKNNAVAELQSKEACAECRRGLAVMMGLMADVCLRLRAISTATPVGPPFGFIAGESLEASGCRAP